MRVVQISSHFYPYIGGVEKVVYELSKQLVSLGHFVTILTTNKKSSIRNYSGITVIKSKSLIEIYAEPISISLFNFLKKSKADIVHIHSSKVIIPDISVIVCHLMGLPSIITLHIITGHKSLFKKLVSFLYDISIRRLVLRFVDKIIVPSKINLEKRFIERYKNKILVIPHGINLEPQNKRKKYKKFRVLFVGKLEKRLFFKGLNFLIKAMNELNEKIELIVIGEGELKESYKKLAKNLGVGNRVKFLGYVKENELRKWYSKVDCLVLPSISKLESFGLVALEAMSMKVPVIVTNVCGISSIVKDSNSGIVIEPRKPKVIASAIKKLFFDKKLREKLGRNAVRTAKMYEWKKIAKRYIDVYKDVLKRRNLGGNGN
jgi:glycosyltransferase involved in cell wall biosynthesis